MSATLKFGTDGNWATKKGSLLAYNSENGNFKPLPFNFSRASKATVINKNGLIETVGGGEPRIDYKDDSKGALLLEPSRTNLITYSENFNGTGWSVFGASGGTCTRTLNYGISPDGSQNSTRAVFSDANTALYFNISISVASTATIYVKGVAGEIIGFGFGSSVADGSDFTFNGEWQRLVFSGSSGGSVTINTWAASRNARDFEIYGVQLEQGSYATSYIPTQGSIGTRLQEDSVKQILTNSVVGQTQGTIFYDINMDNINSNSQYVGVVSDGTSSNRIQFLNNSSQQWQLFISASTISNNISLTTNTSGVGRYKIAIAYESGNVAYYINGVQKGTSSETFTFSNLLHFDLGQRYDDNLFLDNSINETKLYNTRLSNTELQALTTI